MPWKLSKDHDGDKEVFLDENPEEASSSPAVSPLPPIIMEEPVEKIRNFYVTAKDVAPSRMGVGFTDGCKGCRAIVNGKNPVAHSDDCRLRVMAEAPNNDKIAARVKRSAGKDHDNHARHLERNEEKRKKAKASPLRRRRWLGEVAARLTRAHRLAALRPREGLQLRQPRQDCGREREELEISPIKPRSPLALRPVGPRPDSREIR